jgi:hypothetical protein
MITGVAKRMAAQFFAAVDDELVGRTVVPIESAPSASAAQATSDAPVVFSGRPAMAQAPASGDLRSLAIGAVGGALVTLLGVAVGYVLGRRSTPSPGL